MNRWTSLFHPCLIATVLTLAMPQNTLATTCSSLNNCNYHASYSEQDYRESERNEHPYRTGIAIIFITLVTTKIAKYLLKYWLLKP